MYQCLTCGRKFKPYKDDNEFYDWVIHRKCESLVDFINSKMVELGE
jgi:DNA-directed RNA polymerase subunit RPC12/RpoP